MLRVAAARRPPACCARVAADGQSVPQAVPDDRRTHAAAAGGLPGDGRADALPPRAGLRRGLRAGARAAASWSSRPRTTCCCSPPRAAARWSRPSPTWCAPASRRWWPAAASSASAGPSSATPTERRRSTGRPSGVSEVDPAELDRRLADAGGVEVVFTTLSETSTGVVNDVRELTEVCHRHGALIAVDAVSGLGAVPLPQDEWGVDVVVAGSQKALMAPPGLGFASPNEAALERAAAAPGRRYYFDWEPHRRRAAQGPARQSVHPRRGARAGARRGARHDRGGGARRRLRAPSPARPRHARGRPRARPRAARRRRRERQRGHRHQAARGDRRRQRAQADARPLRRHDRRRPGTRSRARSPASRTAATSAPSTSWSRSPRSR